MPFNWSLRRRQKQPELMDQPDLPKTLHVQALRGLGRINWWSTSAALLWPPIRDLARQVEQPLRVLDVATGGGDIPIRLWHRARNAGLPLEIAGCDISPTALEFATEAARQLGAEVNFFPWDVLEQPLPNGYDVVISSLFLHHLEEDQAVTFLRSAADSAGRAVFINDLRRCRAGLIFAQIGTRLLTASPVVHTDGPLSVRAAFTLPEVRTLTRRAGLDGAAIVGKWPFRFLLRWYRNDSDITERTQSVN